MFITLPCKERFTFAGLRETWDKGPESDSIYKSCTIITTQASRSVIEIHNRMPAILKTDTYEPWLDPENDDTDELKNILQKEIIIGEHI